MTHLRATSLEQARADGWEIYDRTKTGYVLKRKRPDGQWEWAILETAERA